MATTTQTRRNRTDSPTRWLKAAERALSEGVQVRQLQGTGQWVANSGSDAAVAYEVQIVGNVAIGCDCLAGLNDDPVCKHRAAWYLLIGSIDLNPEPEPPAPVLTITCSACSGGGVVYSREAERYGAIYPPCAVCQGTGTIAAPVEIVIGARPAVAA